MKTRQKFLDIVCILIIGLVCFFFAGGFAWDLAKVFFGPLIIVSLFATMTFSSGDSQWLMTRNLVSVLSMDLSIIWLAVLSVILILKGNNDYF